jgi:exodeoxyribonuclease VII large subunit
MRPFGEGDLAAEFERIKKKLDAEGLFSAERKRQLPQFPKQIAIVTSETGAALQDILQILSRRYPICSIKIYPALVQGVGAPKSIISALNLAYDSNCDVIIVGRGGGSTEDLSCFNDEELARMVAKSPVPVISAVGHEIDFTICDFVSDLRAPTPSAAAELATPDLNELLLKIQNFNARIKIALTQMINGYEQQIKQVANRRCFSYPELLFSPYELRLDSAIDKLKTEYLMKLSASELRLEALKNKIFALSPQKILERGYSAVYCNKKLINSVNDVNVDDSLNIKLSDGLVECKVISVSKEELI